MIAKRYQIHCKWILKNSLKSFCICSVPVRIQTHLGVVRRVLLGLVDGNFLPLPKSFHFWCFFWTDQPQLGPIRESLCPQWRGKPNSAPNPLFPTERCTFGFYALNSHFRHCHQLEGNCPIGAHCRHWQLLWNIAWLFARLSGTSNSVLLWHRGRESRGGEDTQGIALQSVQFDST